MEAFESVGEVCGKCRGEGDRLACGGMVKGKKGCVERQPCQVILLGKRAVDGAFTVVGVTDNGMGDVFEVAANLVEASGLWVGFYPGDGVDSG